MRRKSADSANSGTGSKRKAMRVAKPLGAETPSVEAPSAAPPPLPAQATPPSPPPAVQQPAAPHPVVPPANAAPLGLVTSDDEGSITRRRASRRAAPTWLVWGLLGLVLAVGIGVAAFLAFNRSRDSVADATNPPAEEATDPNGSPGSQTGSDSDRGSEPTPGDSEPDGGVPGSNEEPEPDRGAIALPASVPASQPVAGSLPAAVGLDVVTADGTHQAAAVLVDDRGWFLTPLHVLADAEQVSVRFPSKGDLALPSTGIVAVHPGSDLALIAVGTGSLAALNADGSIQPVEVLAAPDLEDDAKLTLAAPHPERGKIVPCEVERAVAAANLPPNAKAVWRQRTGADLTVPGARHWWQLSLPPEGLPDGTPLFTEDGQLGAIIYHLNDTGAAAFARSGLPLGELMRTATGKLTEFGQPPLQVAGMNAEDDPLKQFAATPEEAAVQADQATDLDILSVQALEELLAEGQQFEWTPEDHVQYRRAQWMGRHLTEVGQLEREMPGQQPELKTAADALLQALAQAPWPRLDARKAINELAVEGMDSSEIGFFGYGEVLAVVPGEGGTPDLVFMKLTGSETAIVMRATEGTGELPTDSRWLVLGYRNGQRVQLNLQIGGEAKEYPASGIESVYLIGELPDAGN